MTEPMPHSDFYQEGMDPNAVVAATNVAPYDNPDLFFKPIGTVQEQIDFSHENYGKVDVHTAYAVGKAAVTGVEVDFASTETATPRTNDGESGQGDNRTARRAERLAQNAELEAEIAKTNPFNPDAQYNDVERMAAQNKVRDIAEQSRLSGIPLTAGHKRLNQQLEAGEISGKEYDAKLYDIIARFAVYNPVSLQKQQDAQHAAIDKRILDGRLPVNTMKVNLVSEATKEGVQLDGVEAVLARQMGARTYEEFRAASKALLGRIYSGNFGKERMRTAERILDARDEQLAVRAAEIQGYNLRRTRELIDDDITNKNKKKKNENERNMKGTVQEREERLEDRQVA